jgi:hypothetical protein
LLAASEDFVFCRLFDLKIHEDILQAKFAYLVEGGSGVFFLETDSLPSLSYR